MSGMLKEIVNYEKMDKQLWYKVKWVKYTETIWEPEDNLKNIMKKIEKYYKKIGKAVKKKTN